MKAAKTLIAVTGLVVPAGLSSGAVVFFTDQALFQQAMLDAGKVIKAFEDFEDNTLGAGAGVGHDDPLNYLTSDPGIFPNGLAIDNVSFQSNDMFDDGLSPSPDPGGDPNDVIIFQQGFFLGADNAGVGSNSLFPVDGFDIISGFPEPDNHTGMELSLVAFGGAGMRVRVFDINNVLLGETIAAAPLVGGGFLGIQTTGGDVIGRVNLHDVVTGGSSEAIYSIGVWFPIPGPGAFALLGLAGVFGLGRSRRRV